MSRIAGVVILACLGAAALSDCRCAPPCGATTCAAGCCDLSGRCVDGFDSPACGAGGGACQDCTPTGRTCVDRRCAGTPTRPCGQCAALDRRCAPGLARAYQACLCEGDPSCCAWGVPRFCAPPAGPCVGSGFCRLPDGGCEGECSPESTWICVGNDLYQCQPDTAGCLAWTRVATCTPSQFCRSGSPPGCVCAERCEQEEAVRCRSGTVQECWRDDVGCLDWVVRNTCPAGTVCSTQDGGSCPCVRGCSTPGQRNCPDPPDSVLECRAATDGCLDWFTLATCGSDYRCDSWLVACLPKSLYPIGSPCADNTDCQGPDRPDGGAGFCKTAWPGGYCSLACDTLRRCSSGRDPCVDGECRRDCRPFWPCLDGYQCQPTDGGSYCRPDCRDAGEPCPTGTACEGDSGVCR